MLYLVSAERFPKQDRNWCIFTCLELPLLPGTCNWIILRQFCQVWKKNMKQKYSLLPRNFYFLIWGKTVPSPELVKHYLTKTLVGNKVVSLMLGLVLDVMWIVPLTYLPEYKVYLTDWWAYHLGFAETYVANVIHCIRYLLLFFDTCSVSWEVEVAEQHQVSKNWDQTEISYRRRSQYLNVKVTVI